MPQKRKQVARSSAKTISVIDAIAESTGLENRKFITQLINLLAIANFGKEQMSDEEQNEKILSAAEAIKMMRPSDPLEAALTVMFLGTYEAYMKLMCEASMSQDRTDSSASSEKIQLYKNAEKLGELSLKQLNTLMKYSGKNVQKVIVEHLVHNESSKIKVLESGFKRPKIEK